MNKQQLSGYSMAGIGFLMVFVIVLSYVFNWDNISPAFAVMGIIFIATGLRIARR